MCDDEGWYCECCERTVQDIICIEASRIPYSDPLEKKLFEHYFCEDCFEEILDLIKEKSKEE